MAAEREKHVVQQVLDEAGGTMAREAGIDLADRSAPVWQLLVLVNLVSTRISADIAVAAARELNRGRRHRARQHGRTDLAAARGRAGARPLRPLRREHRDPTRMSAARSTVQVCAETSAACTIASRPPPRPRSARPPCSTSAR
ncbi:hypothetical protein GCM10023405_23560 [Streptomonospora salina]